MTNVGPDLDQRVRRYVRQRMGAAERVTSRPVLPVLAAHRSRSRRIALGVAVGIAAVAVILVVVVASRHPGGRSPRSSVVGPGKVRIAAVSSTRSQLTSEQVPDWVAAVATEQKWQIAGPSGRPGGYAKGLQVTAAYYVANATSVKIYQEGNYSTPHHPQDLWVVLIDAPPQAGFSSITGSAVINASTHQIVETSFFATLASKPGAAS